MAFGAGVTLGLQRCWKYNLLSSARAGEGCRGEHWVLTPQSLPATGQSLSPAPEQPELSSNVNLMAQENRSRTGAQQWPSHAFMEPEAWLVALSLLLQALLSHQLLCQGPSFVPSLPAQLPVLLLGIQQCQQQAELGW